MQLRSFCAFLLVAAGQIDRLVEAQRPENANICDYYATVRHGENTTDSQYRLMQSIVALAFGGGDGVADASEESTGVFNPGRFDGRDVNLRSWFDGTRANTNFNGQPHKSNWLDGGAEEPLMDFLRGTTKSVEIQESTNQYRLFAQFTTAFGFVFGCTNAREFPRPKEKNAGGGRINLAYVHKYMNLNQTHLGHFINQLSLANRHFGFSETDSETLADKMNARYNVRCAPPEGEDGQLFSICQAEECPLAVPSADCDAYVNLGPGGAGTGSEDKGGGADEKEEEESAKDGSSDSGDSADTSDSEKDKGSSGGSSAALSPGAIAGISIGSAAVALLGLGMVLLFLRKSAKPQMVPVPYHPGHGGSVSPTWHGTNAHTSISTYNGIGGGGGGPHDSQLPLANGIPYHHTLQSDVDQNGVAASRYSASSPQNGCTTSGTPRLTEIAEMESPHGVGTQPHTPGFLPNSGPPLDQHQVQYPDHRNPHL